MLCYRIRPTKRKEARDRQTDRERERDRDTEDTETMRQTDRTTDICLPNKYFATSNKQTNDTTNTSQQTDNRTNLHTLILKSVEIILQCSRETVELGMRIGTPSQTSVVPWPNPGLLTSCRTTFSFLVLNDP